MFCIGEVYGSDIGFASQFQKQKWMDSILGFPLYYGLVQGFGTPNGNMSAFVDIANQVLTSFPVSLRNIKDSEASLTGTRTRACWATSSRTTICRDGAIRRSTLN